METRLILYAEDGMILTDGEHFGRCIYLSKNADADAYYEITEEEYEKICAEQETNIV